MELFIIRLKELLHYVVFVSLITAIVGGLMWTVNYIPYADIVFVFIIGGGMTLGLAYIFLNWLIIEPFMDSELAWKIEQKIKRK